MEEGVLGPSDPCALHGDECNDSQVADGCTGATFTLHDVERLRSLAS